jgi:hypothetical protein
VRLNATERKVEMSSTSPVSDTDATHPDGNEDSAEKYLHDISGEAEGIEVESPQAKQAKAEALAHTRAARAARARYARLTSLQTGVGNRNAQNKMQAESYSDVLATLDQRINGTEWSLLLNRVSNQLVDDVRTLVPEDSPFRSPVLAAVSNWPVVLLRHKRGSGVWGFLSDPRVWTFPVVAALAAVGDQLNQRKRKEAERVDQAARSEKEEDQLKGERAEMLARRESDLAEARKDPVRATPRRKSS